MKGRTKRTLDRYRQQQIGITHYIWRSQDDDKVRPDHAAYDDQIRKWGINPHPGEDFNCRCYAELAANEAGEPIIQIALAPVWQEALLKQHML